MKLISNYLLRSAAFVLILLIVSNAFGASDYLLEIEGIKGECKGKKFTLKKNANGSFTISDVPGGTYMLVAKVTFPYSGQLADQGELVNASSKRKGVPDTMLFEPGAPVTLNLECTVSPRDAASGQPTGKRQHKPIRIRKELDKMSPKGSPVGEIVVGDLDGDGAAEDKKPPKAPFAGTYDIIIMRK